MGIVHQSLCSYTTLELPNEKRNMLEIFSIHFLYNIPKMFWNDIFSACFLINCMLSSSLTVTLCTNCFILLQNHFWYHLKYLVVCFLHHHRSTVSKFDTEVLDVSSWGYSRSQKSCTCLCPTINHFYYLRRNNFCKLIHASLISRNL